MGEQHTQLPVPPPVSQRSKRGLIVGALVGAVLFRPVSGLLALLGWLAGGVVGAEVFASGDESGLDPLYAVETLSFSLFVVLSEFGLVTVLWPSVGRHQMDLLLLGTALVALLAFLWCDSLVRNWYNLLMVFGIFGLLTLASVPILGAPDGGSPIGPDTPTESPSTSTAPPTTTRPATEPPPTATATADPNWRFTVRFVDDGSSEYYAVDPLCG
ncbi:MAG: hypothetical protein ABEI77_09780 [Halorientalis sp.]